MTYCGPSSDRVRGGAPPAAPDRSVRLRQILRLTVNGEAAESLVAPHQSLADFLREDLGLTGTKHGCDLGDCGACTVLVDGEPRLSCITLALECEGREVTTIEGVARDGRLHPVQEAFDRCVAAQCGYCTPGLVLSCVALLRDNPSPSEAQIRAGLSGNICRCTGYTKIMDAVREAAVELAGQAPSPAAGSRRD